MKKLFTVLFVVLGLSNLAFSQAISIDPVQTNYENWIQITNNTVPALTAPNIPAGTYGDFVRQWYTYAGPCLNAGAIRTVAVNTSHEGTGYAVGDLGTINGGGSPAHGSGTAIYQVSAVTAGAATAITLVEPPLSQPWGAGYSVATAVATTATTGSGSGLAVNITAVFAVSGTGNCTLIEDVNNNAGWASAIGQSVTFANSPLGPTTLNGTFTTAYGGAQAGGIPLTQVDCSLTTNGVGQTDGIYTINPTGGGGTGASYALTISDTNPPAPAPPVLGTAIRLFPIWYGSGYTSAPTATVQNTGGTTATVTCTIPFQTGWAFDTSVAVGGVFMTHPGNSSGGVVQDNNGNTWRLTPCSPGNYLGHSGNLCIQKSTNNGVSWSAYVLLVYDGAPGAPGALCGPTATPIPCSYAVGSFMMAPNGNLTMIYWRSAPSTQYWGVVGPFPNPTCCSMIQCNPSTANCDTLAGWTNPVRIPITLGNSPNGYLYAFNYGQATGTNGTWWPGDISFGVADQGSYDWIVTSCDSGATWGTGANCTNGENYLMQVTSPATGFLALPTIEWGYACYTNCSTPPSSTLILMSRENYMAFYSPVITSVSIDSNIATITANNQYGTQAQASLSTVDGQFTGLTGAVSGLNGLSINGLSSTGLSATQFQVPFNNGGVSVPATPQPAGAYFNSSYCITPGQTCGAVDFGYSLNGGSTWTINLAYLTPYVGRAKFFPATSGLYGVAGAQVIKTPQSPLWTFMILERDETSHGTFLYVNASTVDPQTIINNLASWTISSFQTPLWFYTVNYLPSTVFAGIAGGNNIAYNIQGGPGNVEEGYWFFHGMYSFSPLLGTALIGVKGVGVKGVAIHGHP